MSDTLTFKQIQEAAAYLDSCDVRPEDRIMMTARTAEEMAFIFNSGRMTDAEALAKAKTAAYIENPNGDIIYVFDDENGERQRVRVSLVYMPTLEEPSTPAPHGETT